MSSMQIQIAKIIAGIFGIIISMLILYYAVTNKAAKEEHEKICDSKVDYEVEKINGQETAVLDNATDNTELLDDKNKDDTVCL